MKINWQQKRWIAFFPLAGLLILLLVVALKSPPKLKDLVELAPLVNVQKVKLQTMRPEVVGFGRVKPKESWQALAESSGRIIYRNPELEAGKTLKEGTLLLKIDPVDYQLKLAQAVADLHSAEVEIGRIEQNKQKLELSLKLEKQRLGLTQTELKRKQGLAKQGSVSKSAVDLEQSNLLAQQQKIVDLENNLKLIPAEQEVAKAKIAVNQSRQQEAERKLAKTEVILPFDARIVSVNAELEQYVSERELMITAHKLGMMEVATQVAMPDMRRFAAYLDFVGQGGEQHVIDVGKIGLDAEVTLYVGESSFSWAGTLTSVAASLDAKANTVALMVDVPIQVQTVNPYERPPLINDMYVQVKVFAKQRELLAVPTKALHGNKVYVMDDEQHLQIREVATGAIDDRYTAITKGLAQGETLVLNDVIPAIPGMLLRAAEQSQ